MKQLNKDLLEVLQSLMTTFAHLDDHPSGNDKTYQKAHFFCLIKLHWTSFLMCLPKGVQMYEQREKNTSSD